MPTVSRLPVNVSQAPVNNGAAHARAPVAADSAEPGAHGKAFAAALQNEGPKPVRKAVANKAPDDRSTGAPLPAAGNPSPPQILSAAAAPSLLAATPAGGAVNGPSASGTAPVAAASPNLGVGAHAPASATPADAALAGSPKGLSKMLGLAVGAADEHAASGNPSAATAAAAAPAAATGVATSAALADEIQLPGAAQAAEANKGLQSDNRVGPRAASAPLAQAATATAGTATKPTDAAATTVATTAPSDGVTSLTPGADGNMSTIPGATTNAAASQAATAATMSAALTGVVAVASGAANSSSLSAEGTKPPPGSVTQNAGGPTSAVPAGAAASAQAVAVLASVGPAEKHSHSGTGESSFPNTTVDGTAAAAQLSVNSAAVIDAAPAPTLKVAAGVETPEFGQGVADRVSWMVDNNLNGAKLQVNPPQLGPIEVRIAVQGAHAQIWLTSHSALTRDALESSSPKLREMLGAQGFAQVSVDISQRSFQERSPQSQPYEWTPAANRSPAIAAAQSIENSLPRVSNGAVDAYA